MSAMRTADGVLRTENYFDPAFHETDRVIAEAREALRGLDFDTFVVTGVSGTSVGLLLAHALGKRCLVVRKPDDNSTHDYNRVVGALGARWVFLDDFISTGRTGNRVAAAVGEWVREHNGYAAKYEYKGGVHECEFAGVYTYGRSAGVFCLPNHERAQSMRETYRAALAPLTDPIFT